LNPSTFRTVPRSRLDQRPYQAAFDQVQADVKRAETRLELAETEMKRAEALRSSKAISEEELDSRATALRDAQAALTWSKAGLATAQLNLGFTRITAPVTGRIGRRLLSVGSLVEKNGPESTVLATMVSLDPMYCYFDADERAFLRYRAVGGTANPSDGGRPPIPCEVGLANEEGFPHKGHLDFFDNQVDAKSGTIRLRAVLENGDRSLVPGLFARVRVPGSKSVEMLLIPDAAIGSDQGRKFVYVVGQDAMIGLRPIQTGRPQGTDRAVLSGLTTNDSVVVNGLMMLRPGIKVQVQEQTAAIPAAGTASTH
jgi:RND family efflux transporter MFP subunit